MNPSNHPSAVLESDLLREGRAEHTVQPAAADLAEVIRKTLSKMEGAFHPSLQVQLDLQQDTKLVRVEPVEVSRVVMLLCQHAQDVMVQGGLLLVEVFTITLEDSHPKVFLGEGRPGEYSVLALSDSGHGMDALELERLFEFPPSQDECRAQPRSGLYTVREIVDRCGGHVWVYSEPGYGTQFEVFFPVA